MQRYNTKNKVHFLKIKEQNVKKGSYILRNLRKQRHKFPYNNYFSKIEEREKLFCNTGKKKKKKKQIRWKGLSWSQVSLSLSLLSKQTEWLLKDNVAMSTKPEGESALRNLLPGYSPFRIRINRQTSPIRTNSINIAPLSFSSGWSKLPTWPLPLVKWKMNFCVELGKGEAVLKN